MSYTKRQFVVAAFEEIGLASYVFDLEPHSLQSALRRLDAMVAEWNGKGIRIGYPLPSSPEQSDLDEKTFVPDSANEAIITNLGIRIAPSFGKTISPDTRSTAKQGYNTLLSRAAAPVELQLPGTMPSGAGTKSWRRYNGPFIRKPIESIDAGPDGPIQFN